MSKKEQSFKDAGFSSWNSVIKWEIVMPVSTMSSTNKDVAVLKSAQRARRDAHLTDGLGGDVALGLNEVYCEGYANLSDQV